MPLISSLGVMNPINFGLASSPKSSFDYIIGSMSSSPFLAAYKFTASGGFSGLVSNPATLPTVGISNAVFNATNSAIVCADNSAASITAYAWNNGFGTKFANPSTAVSSCLYAIFDRSSSFIFAAGPGIYAYAWSNTTGFGAKYTNPATQPPGGQVGGVACGGSPANFVVTGDFNSPYLWGYSWSNGFATKFANPSTTTFGAISSINIFGTTTDIICAGGGTPFLHAYAASSGNFGTKYANPTAVNGTAYIQATPTVNALIYSGSYSYLKARQWSSGGGFGTAYADAGTSFGTYSQVSVNSAGNVVAVTRSVSPYIGALKWNYTTGFGTAYANPSSTVTSSLTSIMFKK